MNHRHHPAADRPAATLQAEAQAFNTAWGVTLPAELGDLPQPAPFKEMLRGLAMREVDEPGVFQHFFG